jgi:DUF1680 family protein
LSLSIARLCPVPFTEVSIRDRFWAPRLEANRRVTLVHSLKMLEERGYIRNFELAATGAKEGYSGPVYMDSDAYKVIEALSYSLATNPDADLENQLDWLIAKVAAAQGEDGYLNTWFTVVEPGKRWTNLRDCHELYCAGHLFEAAVAHHLATGKRTLLDVAIKAANNICDEFLGEGRDGYCGHPEIELALVKLWRATGTGAYFDMARQFVERRGSHYFAEEHGADASKYEGSYWLDDVPIAEHQRIKGHAVRAAYLMSGVVDVAAETGDRALLEMVERVWRNAHERNIYVTGGIGPSSVNEGFTRDFDLPNLTAYQETCASIALAQWNHRLCLLYGDGVYADWLERTLYNAVIAGVSISGDRFFYSNPLASLGDHHRSEWFPCACCPPNLSRTLASLGGYAYATGEDSIWVNLYIGGEVRASLAGKCVQWAVDTGYPWDGGVRLTSQSEWEGGLHLRIPGWCGDEPWSVRAERGYCAVRRAWRSGDSVHLSLPITPRRLAADPRVKEDVGKACFARGPLIYCAEECDNADLADLWISEKAELTDEWLPSEVGGICALRTTANLPRESWQGGLYEEWQSPIEVPAKLVPYGVWDNREPGMMMVWLPVSEPLREGRPESWAKVSASFVGTGARLRCVNDGREPRRSSDRGAAFDWAPREGTTEWLQYRWRSSLTLAGCSVFWYLGEQGGCQLPKEWRIEALGDDWFPVEAGAFPIKPDAWCRVEFPPVTTTALRLVVKLREGASAGLHEWRVVIAHE